jgi:hypothetical protein
MSITTNSLLLSLPPNVYTMIWKYYYDFVLEEMRSRFNTWTQCYTLDDKFIELRDLIATNLEYPTELRTIYLLGYPGKTTAIARCMNYFDTQYNIRRLSYSAVKPYFVEKIQFSNTINNRSIIVIPLDTETGFIPIKKNTTLLLFN